jgi:ribosomal protein S6
MFCQILRIVYLAKPGQSNETLVGLVHQVKPHFTDAQIEAARRELEEKRYLAKAITGAMTPNG